MENELIYQYPVQDQIQNYEKFFKEEYTNNKKVLRRLAYMIIGFLLSFSLYFIPVFDSISTVFLVISIIILVLTFMFAKSIANKRSLHFLSINADEEQLTLTYYTQAKYYKREYTIPYDKIMSCRFVNSDYNKIQFVLKNTECKYYNFNNEVDKTDTVNFMVFNINPLSYEQAYFLYVAKNYFTIKGYDITDKLLKKYGNADEYFQMLQEGSEQ